MTPPQRPRSGWAWQLGSIAGIPIRVHATLLFLLIWIAFSSWIIGLGPTATFGGLILIACVFGIILIHELGHALVARRFGVRTRDILLLPIGGIASLERIPERPTHELAIALVGPAINVALAAILWGGLALAGGELGAAAGSFGEALVSRLIWINLLLAGFNLLPAFPLDGGRALRALLAVWLPRPTATRVAAALGQALAVVLGVIGLFVNLWLVLIALVIWLGARNELAITEVKIALAGVPARSAMLRRVEVTHGDAPLEEIAARMMHDGAQVVPVVDHGVPVGVLTRADVAFGLGAGPHISVGDAPRHDAIAIPPDEPLDRVLDRLEASPDAIAVVVEGDAVLGVVTPDQLASYVAFHQRAA